jgi:hypothetical protein
MSLIAIFALVCAVINLEPGGYEKAGVIALVGIGFAVLSNGGRS